MTLNELLKKHLTKGTTGQILIKFASLDFLCKISIDDGDACYVSCGNLSVEDSLDYIAAKEIEECKFIDGITCPKRLEKPLNAKLLQLKVGSGPAAPQAGGNKDVPPSKVEALINDFIELVGPVGVMLSDNVLAGLSHEKGSSMSGNDFSALLSSLVAEVPDDEKEKFRKRHLG